jgi:hypothetical protein
MADQWFSDRDDDRSDDVADAMDALSAWLNGEGAR